jgi:hypothetical protein
VGFVFVKNGKWIKNQGLYWGKFPVWGVRIGKQAGFSHQFSNHTCKIDTQNKQKRRSEHNRSLIEEE